MNNSNMENTRMRPIEFPLLLLGYRNEVSPLMGSISRKLTHISKRMIRSEILFIQS